MAVKIQLGVFLVVTPGILAIGYQRFFNLKMEAARPTETLVSYFTATLRGTTTQKTWITLLSSVFGRTKSSNKFK